MYYNSPSLALWMILLGAIILPKANRNPRVLLIILPLLIINTLWLVFSRLLNFPSAIKMQFDMLFSAFTVGIALLWLLAHKLGNRNRTITLLMASIVMIFISIVGQAAYGEFTEQTIIFLLFIIFLSLATLTSFTLAGWRCRAKYSGLRFSLWLALWSVISSLAAMVVFMVVTIFIQQPPLDMLKTMLFQILIAGLVSGLLLYAINLPFLILAFCSPFFRERFYACLRLKSMPAIAIKSNPNLSNEQQNPELNNLRESGSA